MEPGCKRFYCYDCERWIDAAVSLATYHVTCDCGDEAYEVCNGHETTSGAIGSVVYCNGSCEGPAR